MKLQTKKIIAREFIVFILSLVLTLCAFLWTVWYNHSRDKEVEELNNQIAQNTHEADSLGKSYKDKLQNHQWFYYKFNQVYDLPKAGYTIESLWSDFQTIYEHDSIILRYSTWDHETKNSIIKIGFDEPEKLKGFIQRNIITQADLDNHAKAERNYRRNTMINYRVPALMRDKFTSADQRLFSLQAFLIILSALFGLRYFYYAIVWSIKTLREK